MIGTSEQPVNNRRQGRPSVSTSLCTPFRLWTTDQFNNSGRAHADWSLYASVLVLHSAFNKEDNKPDYNRRYFGRSNVPFMVVALSADINGTKPETEEAWERTGAKSLRGDWCKKRRKLRRAVGSRAARMQRVRFRAPGSEPRGTLPGRSIPFSAQPPHAGEPFFKKKESPRARICSSQHDLVKP
jgi:hypothetical protein